MQTGTGG